MNSYQKIQQYLEDQEENLILNPDCPFDEFSFHLAEHENITTPTLELFEENNTRYYFISIDSEKWSSGC